MVDLVIRPTVGAGNKVILKDQAGGTVLSTTDSGVTIENVTLVSITGDSTFDGNLVPTTDDAKDLGSASKRWANLYTADLHLANERGNWTVIEEENYLTLRNNKTNKVYKLVMEEIE